MSTSNRQLTWWLADGMKQLSWLAVRMKRLSWWVIRMKSLSYNIAIADTIGQPTALDEPGSLSRSSEISSLSIHCMFTDNFSTSLMLLHLADKTVTCWLSLDLQFLIFNLSAITVHSISRFSLCCFWFPQLSHKVLSKVHDFSSIGTSASQYLTVSSGS